MNDYRKRWIELNEEKQLLTKKLEEINERLERLMVDYFEKLLKSLDEEESTEPSTLNGFIKEQRKGQ